MKTYGNGPKGMRYGGTTRKPMMYGGMAKKSKPMMYGGITKKRKKKMMGGMAKNSTEMSAGKQMTQPVQPMKMAKGGFPDLTGDGKVTQADILKGRGVNV